MLVAGGASSVTDTPVYWTISELPLHKDKTASDALLEAVHGPVMAFFTYKIAHVFKLHVQNYFHSRPSEKHGFSSADFHETP
jgi:hypothetical protein